MFGRKKRLRAGFWTMLKLFWYVKAHKTFRYINEHGTSNNINAQSYIDYQEVVFHIKIINYCAKKCIETLGDQRD